MAAQTAAIHRNIPDNFGNSAYEQDADFQALLRLYIDPSVWGTAEPQLRRMGELAGGELERLAIEADKNPPTLKSRGRDGADVYDVDKHPSYVALEKVAFADFGLAAMSHRGGVFGWNEKLPPAVKYGLTMLLVQAEFGLCCPLSMTDSLTRTLVKFGNEALIDRFLPQLTSQDFDALFQGAMFMTEQDAGSDVGMISTTARRDSDVWRLTGDKWFCSNPDADLAMVLARPEGQGAGVKALSLFLLPRRLPDGRLNSYRIVRLKSKLGTRSMASGEIVLDEAVAYMVGEPASGFKQMTDMINMSRLSNGVRAAGMMRRSVREARFIAQNREAFGKKVVDLPLMRRQLIKLMVTSEQATAMVLHTAKCLQRADDGDGEAQKLMRILTPLIKFRACRDARKVAGDAMEVRGGCGYIEEWSDARVLRDAHLGSIWEGTSNIVALDVARSIKREGTLPVLRGYLDGLLSGPGVPAETRAQLGSALDRACAFAEKVAGSPQEEHAVRQMASGLYNAVSAIFMAWEAAELKSSRRLALAHLVLKHKLLPRDPLAPEEDDQELLAALIAGNALTEESAARLLAA